MRVEVCTNFTLLQPENVVFGNGDVLHLPAGVYWVAAFGVVVTSDWRCVSSEKSAWKLNPPPRYTR